MRNISKIKVTAGVHTVSIVADNCDRRDSKKPYMLNGIHRHGCNEFEIKINPHKAVKDGAGLYQCCYGSLAETNRRLNEIADELALQNWRFRRIDLCFNIEAPYNETEKLLKLFLLVLGDELKLENRFISADPLTNWHKNISLRTENKHAPVQYQIEIYDRSMKDQSQFDTVVVNRLELRLIGRAISDCNGQQDIKAVCKWWGAKILNVVSSTPENQQRLNFICDRLNDGLTDEYRQYCKRTGQTTKGCLNYLLMNVDRVYSRDQMVAYYKAITHSEDKQASKAVTDKLSKIKKSAMELYSLSDLQAVALRLSKAIQNFITC